ncbi:PDR/VanB family oxidoreductase [Phaeobacter sp. PT47_59]|uniref:PDR/VanB family oxidoreductase n=1 Tax=Phaeobacter sp. PT47_59 TaxID=3029979 RepID=UPI0023802FB0|nr:PDR/VanB family oxidoreductase [Phaeobacter sp. PT47_59]MDE4175416.1 PDR/VanB family oxidoreductase [Phaeobacter sp. PT47_59]
MNVNEDQIRMVVRSRATPGAGVVELELVSENGDLLPAWTPGAHIDVHCNGDIVRQYSLCGDHTERDSYRIAVLRADPGRGGSAFVHDALGCGTKLLIGAPRNNFSFVAGKRYLFIAGGIGITPLLPMIREAVRNGSDWDLWYGGRELESMAYAAELETMYGEHVHLWPQDQFGMLPLETLLETPDPDTRIYCCGPLPMLAAAETLSEKWAPGSFHMERFEPLDTSDMDKPRAFEVELRQSGLHLFVPADQSLLQVLTEAGIEVLCSCREGTCGTCEVPVVDGEVEHRDSVLFPDEQAMNDVMMACVSRAKGEKLVLDL